MDFEIQTVTHEQDSISFTWNDRGGLYKVYKDGMLIYEGTVPECSDGDLKHAKMYTYTIERIEKGQIMDVITMQTSAFAELKSKENPLQQLVFTTIVAKTQIALSWEPLRDVHEYDVYRNGRFMKTVRGNRYIDRDFSLDETVRYAIQCKRPLIKSEELFNVSKSFVSSIFDRLKRKVTTSAAEEGFVLVKQLGKPKNLLQPVMEKERNRMDRWKFSYTTFLADDWVANPNFLSLNRYFKGDGRDFDPHSENFRTRVGVELAYDLERSPMTFTKKIGPSIAYSHLHQFRDKATASLDGIQLERMDHREEESGFHLVHRVGNPLTTAPSIDYEIRAILRQDGTFDMTGIHDAAPHHEVYVMREDDSDWMPIYLAESKGLAWLSRVISRQYWRCSNFE